MKFVRLSFVLFLAVGVSGCSISELWRGNTNPYGPWHGYIYEQTARNERTRVYHGEFTALTNCMDMMQLKVKYTGYAYFCGYNCKGVSSLTCEKMMGSPLDALEGR